MVLVQRSPGAEVVPAEVRRQAEDPRLSFALARARFQHGVVNADVLALRIEAAERLGKFARAVRSGDLFEDRRCVRQMLAQRVDQSVSTPQKHAAVPEIVSGGEKLSRSRQVGLLGEATHAQATVSIGRAGFNVSVTSFGTRGADTKDDNVFSRCGDLNDLAV